MITSAPNTRQTETGTGWRVRRRQAISRVPWRDSGFPGARSRRAPPHKSARIRARPAAGRRICRDCGVSLGIAFDRSVDAEPPQPCDHLVVVNHAAARQADVHQCDDPAVAFSAYRRKSARWPGYIGRADQQID